MCCCLEYLTHQCYFVKLSDIFYYAHGYCSSGLANSMPPTPTTPNFLLILTPILSTSLFQELPVATFSILFSSTFDHSIFFFYFPFCFSLSSFLPILLFDSPIICLVHFLSSNLPFLLSLLFLASPLSLLICLFTYIFLFFSHIFTFFHLFFLIYYLISLLLSSYLRFCFPSSLPGFFSSFCHLLLTFLKIKYFACFTYLSLICLCGKRLLSYSLSLFTKSF